MRPRSRCTQIDDARTLNVLKMEAQRRAMEVRPGSGHARTSIQDAPPHKQWACRRYHEARGLGPARVERFEPLRRYLSGEGNGHIASTVNTRFDATCLFYRVKPCHGSSDAQTAYTSETWSPVCDWDPRDFVAHLAQMKSLSRKSLLRARHAPPPHTHRHALPPLHSTRRTFHAGRVPTTKPRLTTVLTLSFLCRRRP